MPKKTTFKIIIYAVIGIIFTLILNVCVEPVDLNKFLEDDKVQDIVNRDSGNKIIVDLEPIEGEPELALNGAPLSKGAMVTLSLGAGTPVSAAVSVINTDNYSQISWFCNDIAAPLAAGASFTVRTSNPPFDIMGEYILTIEAEDLDGSPQSSFITIKVIE